MAHPIAIVTHSITSRASIAPRLVQQNIDIPAKGMTQSRLRRHEIIHTPLAIAHATCTIMSPGLSCPRLCQVTLSRVLKSLTFTFSRRNPSSLARKPQTQVNHIRPPRQASQVAIRPYACAIARHPLFVSWAMRIRQISTANIPYPHAAPSRKAVKP